MHMDRPPAYGHVAHDQAQRREPVADRIDGGMKARSGSPAAVLSRSKMKAMNATAALEMSALKRKKARSDRGVSVAAASKVADLAYKRILRGGPCPAAASDMSKRPVTPSSRRETASVPRRRCT